jgi:hypothetical protein
MRPELVAFVSPNVLRVRARAGQPLFVRGAGHRTLAEDCTVDVEVRADDLGALVLRAIGNKTRSAQDGPLVARPLGRPVFAPLPPQDAPNGEP